jgi:four helix bundle protein
MAFNMTSEELKKRTKEFALRVLRFVDSLPKGKSAELISKQLSRAATSVGANYRAACKARSKADFISKITIVEEEADESQYWLELMIDLDIGDQQECNRLQVEAMQLTAIFTASGKTAKLNR